MRTEPGPKQIHFLQKRKTTLYAGIVAVVIAVICYFLSCFVYAYLEDRIEQEFVKKYPFSSLKITGFKVDLGRNRIGWDSLELHSADVGYSCNAGAAGVSGVGWWRLMGKAEHKAKALANVVVDVQKISVKFPRSGYVFSCQRLHRSMPDGVMTVSDADLRPVLDDEHYFTGRKYRLTRFCFNIPECRVEGLAVAELFEGNGFQIRSVRIQEPVIDALVDMYAPVDPEYPPSRMPNEMMKDTSKNIRIESVCIIDGKLKYSEIYAFGATPGCLTFDDLQLQAEGIANHGKPQDTALIHAQTLFMHGGIMKLDIAIPLSSSEFSLKYSGSLSVMEIDKLNPFLEHGEYLRIDSGTIDQTLTYDVQVVSGHATGVLNAPYKDLSVSILDKETESSHSLINEIASYLMNQMKLRKENMADKQGVMNIGRVEYKRQLMDTFIQFLWFSLRSGVLDVIFQKPPDQGGLGNSHK